MAIQMILPEINYDFNAPIRQYGTISDNYREIRLLAYFLQDFGGDLAVLPADIDPEFVKPGRHPYASHVHSSRR